MKVKVLDRKLLPKNLPEGIQEFQVLCLFTGKKDNFLLKLPEGFGYVLVPGLNVWKVDRDYCQEIA